MKKLFALVLSAVMLTSVAFAADFFPGSDIKIDAAGPEWQDDTLPENELNTSNYSISTQSWSSGKDLVSSVRIDNDENCVVIHLKPDYLSTKEKHLQGTIKVRDKKKGRYLMLAINCDIGYHQETIDIAGDGYIDTLTVEPDTVYTVKAEDKGYPYGLLTFNTDFAEVSARVFDKEKFFLEYTREPNREILKANIDSDAEMDFLSFKAKPTFTTTATVTFLDYEDTRYIYEIKNNKLYKANVKWDKELESYVLKTRTLGEYVISDKPLRSAASGGNTPNQPANPDTGDKSAVGAAAAIAVFAIFGAALAVKSKEF